MGFFPLRGRGEIDGRAHSVGDGLAVGGFNAGGISMGLDGFVFDPDTHSFLDIQPGGQELQETHRTLLQRFMLQVPV
jgi:hypothetical protein